MNDDSGGGRRSGRRRAGPPRAALRRSVALAAVIAATALLATACGRGDPPPTSKQAAYQDEIAYAQCMRSHGEPGFPDPQPDGSLLIDAQKDHLNRALMNSANRACQHLMPKMKPMTAAQQRQVTAQALRFVACMRTHGIPNMPDPVVNAQGIELRIGSGHGGPRVSPQIVQAAQQACQKLMPGGGP